MLSGPAILRVSVLLIIAGILAAVVQFLLPSPTPEPARMSEVPAVVEPAPATAPPPAAESDQKRLTQERPIQEPPAPPRNVAVPAAPRQMPSDALAFPSEPPPAGQSAPDGPETAARAEIDTAEDSAGPRAIAVVDLNTASVADLNHLRGGGAIGRAIVAKRPYTSVDQLMSKRVLSRAVYERIRNQVMVR